MFEWNHEEIFFSLEVVGKNLLTFSNKRDFDPWQACVKYKEKTTFLNNIKTAHAVWMSRGLNLGF